MGAHVFSQQLLAKLWRSGQTNFQAHGLQDPFFGPAIRHSPPGTRDLVSPGHHILSWPRSCLLGTLCMRVRGVIRI